MKEALTSFDIRLLVQELQALRGAYLDQIYQDGPAFIFRFNVPRRGKSELFVQPGRWLFLGEGFQKPAQPPPFAQTLRKALRNAVIRDVSQRGFDRILLLEWERKTPGTLVFEMFGRGNLLLLKEGEIEVALAGGKWKAREVRRGIPYVFPPEGVNLLEINREAFASSLARQTGSLVKTLATALALGKLYATELCTRSEISPGRPVEELEDEEIETLYTELQGLLGQLESPAPAVVSEKRPVDAIPFPLKIYEGYEVRPYATMSEALQFYFASLQPREEEGKTDPAVTRVERRIRRQERTLTEALEGAEVADRAAAYLYARYQDVDRQLRLAREGRIRDGLDPERKTLTIRAGQASLELHYEEGVDQNAQRFYEQKKNLIERGARIERALEESRLELRRVQKSARRREKKPAYAPSKRFWFDAYRWTLSSQRVLILAGRDARSNEKLVRKHLNPGDRYVHADLTGAPSVVVKEGAEADEQTLGEASRFALAYSKAWRLGLGSGSAFWVTPDQVSKTAESGEYVKRGSFVIRGKRNYVHNLDLILGVGEVDVEGSRRVMGGDPDALRALARRYVVAKPAGPLRRKDLAPRLSQTFEVPLVEVQRVLPSGTFDVTEVHGLREDLFARE